MIYVSTRRKAPSVSFEKAIAIGMPADGGLFTPETLPPIDPDAVAKAGDMARVGTLVLSPFLAGSPLADRAGEICAEAFNFPAPVSKHRFAGRALRLLELHHGPTAAFKDFGARFLTACLKRLGGDDPRPITLLTATSGDTGGAVAAAAAAAGDINACILFPKGGVSPMQERQLCCWPDNVLSLRVDADFDACQALVKRAFLDADLRARARLSSANSINIARLLAQTVYYVKTASEYARETGARANFIVPTGNLGNALACIWAKEMGAPIERIHIAVNANRTLAEFTETGEYRPRPSVRTISNAMDVGAPSNFERLAGLLNGKAPDAIGLTASGHDDEETAAALRDFYEETGAIICPHTAVGVAALRKLERNGDGPEWIVAATAHPSKFNDIVEPIIGKPAPLAPALAALENAPLRAEDIPADSDLLKRRLLAFCAAD